MKELTLTGGARVGMLNASMPLAKLTVSNERMELRASVIGSFVFRPEDVIAIERHVVIPVLGQGIKIIHRVKTYKSKMIFWSFQQPESLIKQIRETGFLDQVSGELSKEDREIIARQQQGGFPLKTSAFLAGIAIWALSMVFDIFRFVSNPDAHIPIGPGMMIGLSFLIGAAVMTLISEDFRKMILKEGRELKDVKMLALIVLLTGGITLLSFSMVLGLAN